MQQRTGFLPSHDGLPFSNSWPRSPAISVRTPAGRIGIGQAARGLCGGMVLAALDYWRAGQAPPADRPVPGDPVFRFIVTRLLASWQVPGGVLRYYRWMRRPDRELSRFTVTAQWPQVRAQLDAGTPVPLGVVTVASASPFQLGHNHQVLAYGYQADSRRVRLSVYDPNRGPDDNVSIEFDAVAGAAASFAHNLNLSRPVRGFFVTHYSPARPPRARADVGGRR
jgi:hypothetical protein